MERNSITCVIYKKEREYVTADIINEKVFQLGQYILAEESERLVIAAQIDEIRGLIYDSVNELREGNT